MPQRPGHPVPEDSEDEQHEHEGRQAPAHRAAAELDHQRKQREAGNDIAGRRLRKPAAPVQEPVIENDVVERYRNRDRGERDIGPG